MHPIYRDPDDRAALLSLLDRTWPGFAGRIDLAARLGWQWDEVTTPFVARDAGRIVAHVGVLDLPMRLAGRDRRVAGIHAVCTDPEHRRRGHFRALMEQALAWVDSRWDVAKLHTSQPELYLPFGFRVVPQHRFHVPRSGPAGRGRGVTDADLPALHELLRRRAPASELFAARDDGSSFGLGEVISSGDLRRLSWLDAPALAVVSEVVDGVLRVHDIVARSAPSLDLVLEAAPAAFERVELWMPADLLAPGAEAEPLPRHDVLMVRGAWPELPPFAVGEPAQH